MFKTTLVSLSLLIYSPIQAACQVDTQEIGDIGPASQVVCNSMALFYPDEQIEIVGRDILSHRNVNIHITIEDQPRTISYKLVGADWKLNQPTVADHNR